MSKRYEQQFKTMVLRYIFIEKKTHNEASAKYGVPVKTIENWTTAYHQGKLSLDGGTGTGEPTKASLLARINKLETENAILKKLFIIFPERIKNI